MNKKSDFLDSPSDIGLISGSIENPFCLPPLSVVNPFLFMNKKFHTIIACNLFSLNKLNI